MNRIFRAATRALLALTQTPATQDALRHCLLLLDGATDVEVQDADFDAITINRQNQRFEEVLRFCRLILGDRTPTVQAGATRSFSLLFDMNKVFERFVAALLCRHVAPRIGGIQVYPQAKKHRRHLMECEGAGVLRLEPDILIEGHGRRLVLDTKWKLLHAAGKRGRGGVGDGDLYQLYAYTRRYDCQRSVLLYPHTPGVEARDFDVLSAKDERSERIAIRQIRLHRNLYAESERAKLIAELEAIVREGLGLDVVASTDGRGDAA